MRPADFPAGRLCFWSASATDREAEQVTAAVHQRPGRRFLTANTFDMPPAEDGTLPKPILTQYQVWQMFMSHCFRSRGPVG